MMNLHSHGALTTQLIRLSVMLCACSVLHSQLSPVQPVLLVNSTESAIIRLNEQLSAQSKELLGRIETSVRLKSELSDRTAYTSCIADMVPSRFSICDQCLRRFVEDHPHSPFNALSLFHRAEIAFQLSDYERSVELFSQSRRQCIIDARERSDSMYLRLAHSAAFWQANASALMGKYEDAAPLYVETSTSSAGPFADDALFLLGQIEESHLNYNKAIEYYSSVTRSYSHGNVVLASKIRTAQCLLLLRESNNAITQLESAANVLSDIHNLKSQPPYEPQLDEARAASQIHYLKAEALNQIAQYRQAVTEFATVINDTTVGQILVKQSKLGTGWSYLNLALWDSALHFYDSVIDSSDADDNIPEALARLYRCVALKKKGDRSQASRELSQLSTSARYTYTALALLELGQLQYEDAQYDKARRTLERAEHEAPEVIASVRINLLLGAVYTEMQEWKKAIHSYQNAEIIARKSSASRVPSRDQYIEESILKRGICFVQDYQYREAIADLNAFVAAHPTSDRVDEALFWLAEAFYRADLMANAEDTYQKILTNFGSSKRREEAMYGLGWTYFRIREFDKAQEAFSRMMSEFPQSHFAPDVFVRKGDALYLTKKYIEAAKAYKEAYRINPKEEQGQYAQFQIGQSLYRAKDYANAITQLRQFVKNFPKSVFADHAIYTVAYTQSLLDHHDEAISGFESLINAYPQSELIPASLYYIANSYYAKGEFENAITRYKTLMGLYPTTFYGIEALRGLQESLSVLGRNDEAIEVGRSYIASNPEGAMREQINMKTIEIFLRKGDYSNAAKEYQDFLKKYPESEYSAEALFLLAKSQLGMNDAEGAQETFTLLFTKYPKSEYAAQGLLQNALLDLSRSNVRRADSLFTIVTTVYPTSDLAARAWYERAQMTMLKGDSSRALEYFHHGADLNVGEYSFQSLYRIAMYYRAGDMNDSARYTFRRIASGTDNSSLGAECVYRIGELYLTEKNYVLASEAFEECTKKFDGIEDWYTLSLINVGECYERLSNNAKAREVYQTIIILHPNDDYGKSAQSRLKRLGKN